MLRMLGNVGSHCDGAKNRGVVGRALIMVFVLVLAALAMVAALMVTAPLLAQDLGGGQLQVAGLRLTISPEAQTVPFDTPTVVETALEGFDLDAAVPAGMRALADFSGPEIDGVLTLETVPGQPFRIPRLRLDGEYQLDNIRLADGEQLLAYAEPRSATVRVTQILVTRVSSRALTLDEIRGYGIVISDDSFQALNFTFGFGVDGDDVSFDVPIVVDYASGTAAVIGGRGSRDWLPPTPRFRPPSIVPFTFAVRRETSSDIPTGGCPPKAIALCFGRFTSPPLVGVLAFPTDVALLHQFFSVVMMVQNGAPEGDVLTVRDLTARIQLPPGLRQAETDPPTPLGVPVPVRVPGPDGELGTADDLTFLIAQATGEAGFLVEGLREGTHVVDFTLDGVLDGLPTGPQRIEGTSRGAVVVRDPHLQVTINHPDVVRDGEPYPLRLTVSNIGPAPVNLVSLTLPVSGVSGADVVGDRSRTIATLSPGDGETVTFDLIARRTGRVVASTAKSGSSIAPQFEFSVGVSNDIPLSPDTLILPRSTDALPSSIVEPAISLLGLGHSLATASESDLAPHLPRVTSDQVSARIYRLAQAGRHRALGEPLFETAAILAAELSGARDGFAPWDALRRSSAHGETLASGFATIFDDEALATSPAALFDRLVSTTGFLPARHLVLVDGPGATIALTEPLGAGRLSGFGAVADRTLPMAELYPLTGGVLASVEMPSTMGYRLDVGGTGSLDVHLLVPEADGSLRVARWTGVVLAAEDTATVDFALGSTVPDLLIDRFSDGLVDQTLSPTLETSSVVPFAATLAVQNIEVDPSGHVVDVLFSRDVDPASLDPRDPSHFVLPGRVSNGGFVQRGLYGTDQNPDATIAAMSNFRMVRVVFDNPLDPLATNDLSVDGVAGSDGQIGANQSLPVVINASTVGAPVEGVIIGPDGAPVAFAEVRLYEYDESFLGGCVSHRTAAVRADVDGRFRFDFVRGETCDSRDRFRLEALDPVAPWQGDVTGRVRISGELVTLNVVMLGRGRIEGTVRFDDGTVPEGVEVIAYNDVFQDGRRAIVTPDGRYYVNDVVVGAVSLSAHDADGNFVFATVELPLAGAIVNHDLVVPRASPVPTGQVRGTVVDLVDSAPVADSFVALYVDARLIGVRLSGFDGRFDFGVVPSGVVEIEAFHPETHETGGQLFFEVAPDEVQDVTVVLRDDRGSIEGHVYRQSIDGTLTPIANAVVWIHLQGANTVTDATGAYRLDGVLAGTVSVRGADPVTGLGLAGSTTVPVDGTATRDLILVEGGPVGAITGQVLGFDGQPVAGATIHIGNGHPNPINWQHREVTDAQGDFVLADMGPGTYPVHAIAGSQGGIAFATVRFPGDTPNVTVRFKRGEIRLRTYVRDLDGVLVGISSQVQMRKTIVRFELVGKAGFPTGHQTDAQGLITFPNTLVGEYEMFVSNPFHGEKRIQGVLVEDGDVVEHEVIFEPAGSVRGVVLGHDGVTPVAGAIVALEHGAFSDYDVTTDAAGAFAFELVPPGSFSVRATVDGLIYRTTRVSGRLTRPGEILEGVELVLPRQGAVTGQVEDSNGAPVPGAVVSLREYAFPRRMLEANADLEGRFAFDNVFAGEIGLRAQAPTLGGLGGRASTEISAEGQSVEVLITLEDTGELSGQVLSPVDGSAVPFAEVSLRSNRGFVDAANADEDGQYRFRLLPLGAYEVRAFEAASGRFGRNTEPMIVANGDLVEADVVLQARGEVDGHVSEPELGGPVPAATVKLTSATPFFTLHTYSSSDVDGYFLFGGIPEGTFRLSTQEPDSRRRASGEGEIVTEDERATVDLVFERFGTVSGAVLNPPGTDPGLFPNVNTRAIKRTGGSLVLGATLDNPYLFDGLLPNELFEIHAEEIGGDHRGIARGRLGAAGDDMTLDVTMVAIGSVRVAVFDSFGVPVPGVDVSFVAQGLFGGDIRYDATGTDHEVVFTDVQAGVVSVSVKHPVTGLRGSASGSLTLEGETVVLSVSLQDTGFVRGRVLLADGVTPALESLAAVQQGSRFLYSAIGSDGSFAFEGVTLGSYELILQESLGSGQYQALGTIDANGEIDDFGDVVLDEHDPTLVSITPASGTRDLPLDTVAVLVFDEPMDATRFVTNSSVLLRVLGAFGGHSTQPSWSADGTTLTLTPIGPLASGTVYELVVSQNLYDLAGRRLPSAIRVTFYTADVIPPAVIDSVPADGAVEVPIDSQLLITFSEPVALFSLSGAALQLDDLTAGAGVSTTFQLRPGEREVILTPVGGLVADRQYRITVQNVEDLAGNVQSAPESFTFWSPDETPPTVGWTAPADGASFVAGESMALAVQANDNREIARVEFTIDGGVIVDDTTPYEVTVPAPVVTAAGPVVITATAIDAFGNTTSADRSFSVTPRVNGDAPKVETPCLNEGDRVLSGVELPISVTLTDDEAVERFSLWVDGVLVEEVRFGATAVATHGFTWTPPADAVPGTAFALRVDTRDYAGNTATHTVSVEVPAEPLLTGDQTIDATWNGQTLALVDGVFTVDGALSLAELSLLPGATLEPAAGTTLDVTTVANLRVQCGAMIDATGAGFAGGASNGSPGGAPTGLSAATPDAGGSHGGVGLAWDTGAGGEVYDSLYWPTLAGGGGSYDAESASGEGGAGGGIVVITADELVVAGTIRAQGEETFNHGAGAGGSIAIDAEVLRGAGLIDASGGGQRGSDNQYCSGKVAGSGGGGRVALSVTALDGFDPAAQALARGGRRNDCFEGQLGYGGAGTVIAMTAAEPWGALYVDAGSVEPNALFEATVQLPELGEGAIDTIVDAGADAWVSSANAFRPRCVGAAMILLDAGGQEIGTFRVAEVDQTGRARLTGAAGQAGVVGFRGAYRFDRLSTKGVSLLLADPLVGSLVIADDFSVSGRLSLGSLTILAGATVRPAAGDSLILDIADTLTVEAGASIDASGLGYPGGILGAPSGVVPPWVVASGVNAGGSHGGAGILWRHFWNNPPGPPGDVYDSVYWPTLAGGGGARRSLGAVVQDGRAGGGVLIVEAGVVVLDGALVARGETDDIGRAAAGAGGSISVRTTTLQGVGSIDVSGGDVVKSGCPRFTDQTVSGAGGGGRVALWAGTTLTFDAATQVIAHGGATRCLDADVDFAEAGTIYVLGPNAVDGTLYIDNGGDHRPAGATALPELGNGTVASWTDAGADAWLSATGVLHPRWVGAWMELVDSAGSVLGSYRVAAIDELGRAQLTDAAGITNATTFVGHYRFDEVVAGAGGGLEAEDPLAIDALVFDGAARLGDTEDGLAVNNMTLREGAFVHLTDGHSNLQVSGTLTVEVGAVLDATGTGYPGGAYPVLEGGSPASVTPATGRAGGSHGGVSNYTSAGDVYDSVYEPRRVGGGGGAGNGDGLPGGGALVIAAVDVVLDGEIRARGFSTDETTNGPSTNGAGAGGTIAIEALSLSGSGLIDASGGLWGHVNNAAGKGGGGGRVALRIADLSAFDVATQARVDGGSLATLNGTTTGFASPGTIFTFDQNAVHGDLWIHQHTRDAETLPDTMLPAAGLGTLASVVPDATNPTDAWVTADAGDDLFGLGLEGMILRVAGIDYPVVDQSTDRTQLLLAGAAGQVLVGDDYVGVYRFDTVHIDGGVTLVRGDVYDVATYDVGEGAVVGVIENYAPVIESVTPAAGTVVLQGWTVQATAVVTDNEAVADVTFSLGGQVIVDETAPYEAALVAPAVVVATDFDLTVRALDAQGNQASIVRSIRVEPGDPPVIASFEPAEGTVYSAGQPIVVMATVTDDDVVSQVSLTFDGQTLVANAAPWSWTVAAPDVSVSTVMTLVVDAVDAQGNTASLSRTIQVEPQGSAAPPALVVDPCPADGDFVTPTTDLVFAFAAADEDGVESWSVTVDGTLVDSAAGLVNQNEIAIAVPWTVPAAAPGQAFIVVVEARNYGGGVATETLTLMVPAAGYLSGNVTLDATYDGQDLVLGKGTYTVVEELQPSSIQILSGATILAAAGQVLDIETSSFTLACGGTVDLTGSGYLGGSTSGASGVAPAWLTASGSNAGGSHGGSGAKGGRPGLPGDVFDSVYLPSLAGGGGGAYYGSDTGGAGGGVLILDASDVVLDGLIQARGESRDATASPPQYYDGGGAGGSVLISTAVLRGTGTIDVSGGRYIAHGTYSDASGGGGGGRVGLWVGETLDFDVDQGVTAFGGTSTRLGSPLKDQAAPGTVLIAGPSATHGHLIVDGGANPGVKMAATALPNLGNEAISVFEAAGADAWITSADGALQPRWLGTTVAVFDASGVELGAFSVVDVSVDGRVLLAGAGALTGAATFEGRYRFDGVTLRQGARLDATDSLDLGDVVTTGEVSLPSMMVATSLTVQANSVLRATHGTLTFDVAGAITIEAGGVIDVDGGGYLGGATSGASGLAPAWVTASGSNAGGSHGGSGAKGGRPGLAGDVYDSVFLPSLTGGGGGAYYGSDSGGVGGGAVMISAGEVVLDGTILARGESRYATATPPQYYDGGGAGGSVLISTAVLRGTGTIDVSGGRYIAHGTYSDASGGGGGGRVGLWVGETLDFDVDGVAAFGGTSTRLGSPLHPQASPGTIVVAGPGAVRGRLVVDGGPNSGPDLATTVLPSLGTASVALLEAAGDDAWITSAGGALPPRWLGTTAAVFDAAGVELGAFLVADLSEDGRILLTGAGVLTGAATFEGRYRFDGVTLRNGGGLDATDALDLGNVVAAGEVSLPSPVVSASLTVQAGAVLSGTHGFLALDVSGVVTIEMGATIDVDGGGYLGGATSGASGLAPAWVTASGSNAGGSHGGSGAKGGRPGLAGDVYDSVFLPSLAGGGGGAYYGSDGGGAGGGALMISAGEVVLDGTILGRGESRYATATPPQYYDGGGAGGSVLISTAVLRGTGTIDVSGGRYIAHGTYSDASGGGGGGRVGLWASETLDFDVDGGVAAFGGTSTRLGSPLHPQASPGTVLIAGPGAIHGRLVVDGGPNTGSDLATTLLPSLGTASVALFEAAAGNAWITSASGALPPRWLGTTVAVFDASGVELGAFSAVDLSDDGRLLLAGAGALSGAATFEGRYRFDGVTLRNGGRLDATDALDLGNVVAAGEVALPSPIVASSLTVQPSAVLRATHGTLALDVAGVVTIEATAMIDLDGGGYLGGSTGGQPGAAPASVTASGSNAGGSHGGAGTKGGRTGLPGDVYDSVYLPSLAGGGGGAYYGIDSGGGGGGLLTIVAAEVVLDGEIRARGASRDATATPPQYYDGGGAGGTVLMSAPVLRGTGTIDVSGGSYVAHSTASSAAGGGGGGRVALWVNETLTFDAAIGVFAVGGTSTRLGATLHPQAAPGTVFVVGPSATDGDLLVDAGPDTGTDPIPDTTLPAVGSGTVGLVEISTDDPTDAWIEPTDALTLFDLGTTGMWVRIGGTDYRVLDEAADRRRVLLAGAAATVSLGDAYQGVYRFDTVIVRRGATVVIPDVAAVGTFDVDFDSDVQTQALLMGPPTGLEWMLPRREGEAMPPDRWADGVTPLWLRQPIRTCRVPEWMGSPDELTIASAGRTAAARHDSRHASEGRVAQAGLR